MDNLLLASAEQPIQLCASTKSLICHVGLTPFTLEENDFLEGNFDPNSQLEFGYPILAGDKTPITRVGWKISADSLFVETVHTYPEEGKGVRSRTEFRVSI